MRKQKNLEILFSPGFIVMAAPAVLAMSKLAYPEREESKFKDFSKMKLGQDEEVKSTAGQKKLNFN